MKAQGVAYDVAVLLGGQIRGRSMRLFEVYSAGNFIESTEDTPFLQIGEHKYGKPILDRAAQYDTDPYDAVKLALVSMDSTLRSNLTVGLPVDLMVYRRDALKVGLRRRINEDDRYFRELRESWSKALRDAYRAIPRPDWAV
jgi:putative proteasome-type protease